MTITNSAPAATDYLWESAVSGNWNIPSLWDPDGTPDSNADTATINATGTPYTVTLNISADLSDLTLDSSDATLSATGKTLTVVDTASLLSGSVIWQSSTWADDGAGTLNNSANMTIRGNSKVNTNTFAQNGQLTIQGSSAGGNAALTVANGFTNSGTIDMNSTGGAYQSYLGVSSGALTNEGQININQGASGARILAANLINNTTVNVNANTTFQKASGSYTNNANFNIATDKTLTISYNSQQFNQDGGTLDVDGALSITSATFNFNGGTITGNAPTITNSLLNIGPGSTGAASFTTQGGSSTLSGDIAPDQTVTVLGRTGTAHATLTAADGFTNSGTINLDSTDGAYQSNLDVSSGTLTNEGQININEGTAGGARRLGANLDNNGTVNINTDTTFQKTNGSYTNNTNFNIATDKTLTISYNSQQFNQDGGTLDVDGTFSITSATFNFNGGTITGNAPIIRNSSLNIGPSSTGAAGFSAQGNSSTLSGDIAPDQTVTVLGCTGGSHATLTAADGFTNSGTINLDSADGGYQSNFYVTSGTLTNEGQININEGTGSARTFGANLENNGTVNINTDTTFQKTNGSYTNNANFNIATDKTLAISYNSQQFNQDSGTLDVDGTFGMSSATFNFNGGTITGNAPIIRNSSLNIGPGSTGAASFSAQGSYSTLNGDIAPGQTVTVLGCSGGSHAVLTAANGFTNSGTINLDSINGGYSSSFYVTSGTLTNEGQINVNEGTAGGRTLSAELANNGIVNISRTVALGKAGADHANSGDFSILEPTAIVTITGDTFTNTAAGTISGVGALNISGVSFVNNGVMSPGLSPGILSITGDYVQSDTGILDIEIGGTVAGTGYDQLAVTGDAFLDGELEVSLINGFIPDHADIFTILVTSGINNYIDGVFDTVSVVGGTFDVLYTDTEVQLTNFVIPEPATVFLLGLGGLALIKKRRV